MVAFREADGNVALVGIKGVLQVNPTLALGTGNYAMELTVINADDKSRLLYIDDLNISKLLGRGDTGVITFYPNDRSPTIITTGA